MSAKVIDLFSKKPLKETADFYDRFAKCLNNKDKLGECPCDVCIDKREIAYKTVEFLHSECTKYNKTNPTQLCWGDLLDIQITAAKAVKSYVIENKTTDNLPQG